MTNLQIDAPKGPNLFARNCLYLIKCSSLISLVFTEVYTVCPKVSTEAHTVPTPQPSNSNINYLVCVSENYLFGKTKFDLSLQFAVLWTLFPVWHFLEGLPNWPMMALPLGPHVLLNPREETCSVLVYWQPVCTWIESVVFQCTNIWCNELTKELVSWTGPRCWCHGCLSATDIFWDSQT